MLQKLLRNTGDKTPVLLSKFLWSIWILSITICTILHARGLKLKKSFNSFIFLVKSVDVLSRADAVYVDNDKLAFHKSIFSSIGVSVFLFSLGVCTPLHLALTQWLCDTVSRLVELGANVHSTFYVSVIIFIINDNNMTFHNRIFHYLVSPFPLFSQYGETPLHKASKNGHGDTVRTLIELGANVHSISKASIIIIILLFLFLFLMHRIMQ